MSEPNAHRPDVPPELAQPEMTDAPGIAREQFVHGLLEWMHLDRREERERRISSLLAVLNEDARPVARVSWQLRHWRTLSGVAAAVVITTAIMLAVPTQTSAVAVVQASLAASKTAGDRRYEVRVLPPRATAVRSIGTLDVRDADHVVIQARTPFGDQVTVGRNEKGAWAVRPDGTVDHYPPRQAWPNWVNFGQNTVLLVSVDELMTWLGRSYNLRRSESAPVPGSQGPACDRITAEHKPGQTPEPPRVELWIDPQSRVVRRMELHWVPRPEAAQPGDEPGDDPEGPMDLRPPPPRREGPQDGPRLPRDPRFDGPPDRRPDGPPDGGPDGPRRRDPGIGLDPRLDGPPGPPRRRPADGGPRGRHPRPEFLGGPPDFAGGHQPPPPKMIAFELVESASFESSWFDPESHVPRPDSSPEQP